MPIEEKELDGGVVEPKWKKVLSEMEKGKFYSMDEMSEKILGSRVFEHGAFLQYLPPEYRGKQTAPNEVVMTSLSLYFNDVAYVESFLQCHVALGHLVEGLKNHMQYFCKSEK